VPLPNQAGAGPAGNVKQLRGQHRQHLDINRYGARLDHKLTANDSLWGSFNFSKGDPYFVAQAFPPTYGSWSNGGYKTQNLNLAHVHTFSPRATNEFRFGWFYHDSTRIGMNTDFDPRTLFPGPLRPALGRWSAEHQHHQPRLDRRLRRLPARQAIHQPVY
jgi:hypothetical protein